MYRALNFCLFVLLAAPSAQATHNVLIIQTDEHNFRTLGCYRKLMRADQAYVWGDGVKVETPNIDWLADNGAICDRYYATSPVCTPSRAALLTGLYPQNTGSIQNDRPLLDSVETFAQVLQGEGYATGYSGKWHLDGDAKPGWEPARKFGFEDNRFMFNRGHWKKLDQGPDGPFVAAVNQKGEPSYGVDGADETTFTTDFLADRTIEFIKENRSSPFCYMVSIPDPHGPNTVRAPYDTMFDEMQFRQPASALAKGKGLPSFAAVLEDRFRAKQMALYFGMVKCIDDNIGRILDTLRQEGLIEKTLVVFTSDHGDMCGEKGRHNKGNPCEGSARIPFVLYAPGLVPAGVHVKQALGTVDFKPTLLGLLGVEASQESEGRDASRLFREGEAPEGWSDHAIVRIGVGGDSGKGWVGAFTRQFKFVVSHTDSPALIDLIADPNELRNRLHDAEERQTIREMAGMVSEYLDRHGDPYADSELVRKDLAWAMGNEKTYSLPQRSAPVKRKGR